MDELEDGLPWWVQLITPELIATLAIVVLVLLVVLAVVAFVVYRRTRRDARWRRAWSRMRLQAMPPGPQRELVRLRLRLQAIVDGVRSAVGLAEIDGRVAGDLPGLLERTEAAAVPLANQLAILESEGDRDALRTLLPPLRRRVDELETVASRLRRAAMLSVGGETGDLRRLTSDADQELLALQAGVDALDRLGTDYVDRRRRIPSDRDRR